MRENSLALRNDPAFSLHTDPKGRKWGKIFAPSVRAMHDLSRKYGHTPNESVWSTDSHWIGLASQSCESFHTSGVAEYPRDLVKAAKVDMPAVLSRFSHPRAAITGNFWDTPAVLANIPLAARTRARQKLAPLSLKFVLSMSSGIDAPSVAREAAKIARAVWDYTMQGGTVTLTVYNIGFVRSTPEKGFITETRVNASDIAAIALALSPAFFRAVTGRLMTAFSNCPRDSIPVPQIDDNPIPDSYYLGGLMRAIHANVQTALKDLQVTAKA